jgi:hypothetical protein
VEQWSRGDGEVVAWWPLVGWGVATNRFLVEYFCWSFVLCSFLCFSMTSFTFPSNPKYFLLHISHQIFRRMHEALNVGKKDN